MPADRLDRHDRQDELFGARRPAKRRGDEDLGQGPAWRIVYWLPEAPQSEIRLVIVLAVAQGHTKSDPNAYELASRRLEALLDPWRRKGGSR